MLLAYIPFRSSQCLQVCGPAKLLSWFPEQASQELSKVLRAISTKELQHLGQFLKKKKKTFRSITDAINPESPLSVSLSMPTLRCPTSGIRNRWLSGSSWTAGPMIPTAAYNGYWVDGRDTIGTCIIHPYLESHSSLPLSNTIYTLTYLWTLYKSTGLEEHREIKKKHFQMKGILYPSLAQETLLPGKLSAPMRRPP